MCYEESPQRLRVSDLRRIAAKRLAELREKGAELNPITGDGRGKQLTQHFWGNAWMKRLALCESGGLCLAPGRSLLRHHCVLDLRISAGCITALVSAQDLYDVSIRLRPLQDEALDSLRQTCQGHIDSVVALLEGKLGPEVLTHLCHEENGILPLPEDWSMSCTCPDWSEPCPHAAAAIYAAGILIDQQPELLFTLRSVSPEALLSPADETSSPPIRHHFTDAEAANVAAMFGIELDLDMNQDSR